MDALVFYISGILMVASALLVVTRKNPVYSAILLVVFFLLTSLNFLVLRSPFLAVVQVLVYGGAIMVLFVFVLMLLNLTEEELDEKVEPGRKLLAGAGSALLFVLLAWAINSSERIQAAGDTDLTGPVKDSVAQAGETREIGEALFSEHILPFEFTSILIFIAIIGAIYLTKTRRADERRAAEPAVEQPEESA